MVAYTARPLVIYTLPLAALVAFFWYKRRRNSSRSDPGGTPSSADDTRVDQSEASPRAATADISPVDTTLDKAKAVEESIQQITKTFEEAQVVIGKIQVRIGSKKVEPGFVEENIAKEVVEDSTDPIVDQGIIEQFQKEIVQKKQELSELKKIVDEVQESVIKIVENSLQSHQQEEVEVQDVDKVEETKSEESESSFTAVDNISIDSEKLDNISIDTGLGDSQDLPVVADLKEESAEEMAQDQKNEEQNGGDALGLEQKLASLGLDTMQQTQHSAVRDSANHSPAEVMLNSPAISTYSDAHSEGSSDSGKGCSDVVTPPSRTPAGGSSVAGDQAPSIYEFVLPQVIVGRLIGRHGAFLQEIRTKTHTNVFIKRHPETNTLKICAIEGSQQDIDAALKMIRQKFPLRRFPDLTLERVTFVKNSMLPINPESLQLSLVEGVNNDVIISSLMSAGHLFLQMPMHMSYQSLYKLTCIMNSVYNTQDSPALPDPKPDVVCVAPTHGGWYRAQILSVDKENDCCEVKFLDYGGYLSVDNSSLRQIRGDFLLLPFQAVECVLANVVPAGGEEEWSEEAKAFVQQMTTQQILQAQVYDYTDTGLPLVYLYYTQYFQSASDLNVLEAGVVLLNQELVTRGFADLIEDLPTEDGQTSPTTSS